MLLGYIASQLAKRGGSPPDRKTIIGMLGVLLAVQTGRGRCILNHQPYTTITPTPCTPHPTPRAPHTVNPERYTLILNRNRKPYYFSGP